MGEIFNSLSVSDWIELFGVVVGLITSIVAIIISVKTLKQNNNAIKEASRANIVFYVEKKKFNPLHTLIIKNFGNSSGKLISISCNPKLDWSKTKLSGIPVKPITDFQNIFLAPNQSIKSDFDFRDFTEKSINISIKYETLGKTYAENYNINIDVTTNIAYSEPDTKTVEKGLKAIRDSIQELSDKVY